MSVYPPVNPTQGLPGYEEEPPYDPIAAAKAGLQNIGNEWLAPIPKPIDVLTGVEQAQMHTAAPITAATAGMAPPPVAPNPRGPVIDLSFPAAARPAPNAALAAAQTALPLIGNAPPPTGAPVDVLTGMETPDYTQVPQRPKSVRSDTDALVSDTGAVAGFAVGARSVEDYLKNPQTKAIIEDLIATQQEKTQGDPDSREDALRTIQARLDAGISLEDQANRFGSRPGTELTGVVLETAALAGAGAPFRGAGLAANLLGRGTQSAARYTAANVLGEVGARAGGAIANEAGAPELVGNVLGGGVLGGLSNLGAAGARGVRAGITEGAEGAAEGVARQADEVIAPAVRQADPTPRLVEAINSARELPGETAEVRSAALRQRVARGAGILESGGRSEQAYRQATGALSGELPRASYDAPRNVFAPEEVAALRAKLPQAHLQFFEELNAERALNKVLDGNLNQIAPYELNLLDRVFGPEVSAAIAKRQPIDWWEEAAGVISLPQTLAASSDLSAPFRQGFVLAAAHPGEWLDSWRPMIKAGLSETDARQLDQSLRNMDWVTGHANPDKAGVAFTRVGGHISEIGRFGSEAEREAGRAFMGRSRVTQAARNIPTVRGSERAYGTFLNNLRGKVYATEAEKMWNAGVRDIKQYEALAKVINHASGWSEISFGQISAGRTGINAFFAPRLFASRIQTALDPIVQPGSLFKPSPRQLAAKQLVAAATVPAAMLTMVALATGASLTWNPIDTDFGKLQFGSQRLDLLGGYSPFVRFVARMAQGEGISSAGDAFDISSPQDRLNLAVDFLRSKESPWAGLLTDLFTGETMLGEQTKLDSDRVLEMLTPFFAQDIYEAARLEGIEGAARAVTGAFGATVLTYETVGELRNMEAQKRFNKNFSQLTTSQAAEINAYLREQGKLERGEIGQASDDFRAQLQEKQDGLENAFIDGANKEALPDIWSDLANQRYGASSQRAIDFKEQLEGFDPKPYDSVIDGYFAQEVKDQYGQVDYKATQELRDAYLNKLLDSGETRVEGGPTSAEFLLDYLSYIEGRRSPFEQDYRAVVDEMDAQGYFNLDDSAKPAFWEEHPALEASWDFWQRYEGDPDATLQSQEAVDLFLLMNQQYGTNWQAKIDGFGIVINANEGSMAAYQELYPRTQPYFEIDSGQRTSWLKENPEINAALVLMGYSTLKLQTKEAERILAELNKRYGLNVAGDLAKNAK